MTHFLEALGGGAGRWVIEPSRLLSPKLSVAQLVERRTVKLKGFGLMRISLGRWFESAR